jgi:MFS family permease
MWVHFTTQFPGNAFLLVWGLPFLTRGENLSQTSAIGLLTTVTVASVILSPVTGQALVVRPRLRLPLAVGIPLLTATAIAAVVTWPGRSPMWLLVMMAVVLGSNWPGSLIGMDYARLANPPGQLGAACSIVNIGGYSATAIAVLGAGRITDAISPVAGDATAHRVAFGLFLPLLAIGLWNVFRWHRRVRAAEPAGQPDRIDMHVNGGRAAESCPAGEPHRSIPTCAQSACAIAGSDPTTRPDVPAREAQCSSA